MRESIQPQSISATASVLSAGRAERHLPVQGVQRQHSERERAADRHGAPADRAQSIRPSRTQLRQINGVLGSRHSFADLGPEYLDAQLAICRPQNHLLPGHALRLQRERCGSPERFLHPDQDGLSRAPMRAVFPGGIDTVDLTSSNSNNKIAGFGVDWTIRPTLINQFHGGYMYQYSVFDPENENIDLTKVFPQAWAYGTSVYASSIYPRQPISSYYPLLSCIRHAELAARQPPVHLRRRLFPRAGSLLERPRRLSHHDAGHHQQRSDPEPLSPLHWARPD